MERLTRTCPKRLRVLTRTYCYILSKFNAYDMNAHTRTHAHTHRLAHARTHARTPVAYQAIRAMRLKKRVLKRERFSRKI